MTRSAIALVMVIAAAGCRTEASASASASASVAYAVVTRERERIVAGSGVGDLELRTRVDAATVFEAASIAKLLVAVCVMQLVEEGKLDLDGDASKYVGFAIRHPRGSTLITLRMLLAHRASIRDPQDESPAPHRTWTTSPGPPRRTRTSVLRWQRWPSSAPRTRHSQTSRTVACSCRCACVTPGGSRQPVHRRAPPGRTRAVPAASSRSPPLATHSIRRSISIRRRAISRASPAPCCATASSTERVS